ncbi:hypothetical protein CAPTEDRAFT_194553 [Capitella teleta]|uniref:Corticotropin-releasing factor domain-containing protein n=1 Tax=Capitella teleta TaxID=283909 RepID=R7UE57_CAPTE|nr:hypothetical protein CAPTEDRAFT_194553 [Capitella teleta]|eukprot:ELU04264.1 hypothetical protein CAPTEDRAFT_194553 [Capitella teleta]
MKATKSLLLLAIAVGCAYGLPFKLSEFLPEDFDSSVEELGSEDIDPDSYEDSDFTGLQVRLDKRVPKPLMLVDITPDLLRAMLYRQQRQRMAAKIRPQEPKSDLRFIGRK